MDYYNDFVMTIIMILILKQIINHSWEGSNGMVLT